MQTPSEKLLRDLRPFIAADRLIIDPLRRLAYGSDASFYRLIPQLVVKVEDEAEMRRIMALAGKHKSAITFRAAGTSLSGQAITDSVLLQLAGSGWNQCDIADSGREISLQPGIIFGWPRSAVRSGPIRRRSMLPRSVASRLTTPAACAAVPRRTATTRCWACA